MSTLVLLILAILLAQSTPTGLEPEWFDPADSVFAVATLTLLGLSIGHLLARRFTRAARDPTRWETSARSFLRAAFAYRMLLLAMFAAELLFWRWPDVVFGVWGLGRWILVGRIVTLLPFLLSILGSWIVLFPGERLLRGPGVRPGDHVLFQVRTCSAFVLGPWILVNGAVETIERLPAVDRMFQVYPFTEWLLAIGFAVVFFLLSPWFLRLVWGAHPLPTGPLRDRLEALARRAGCPARQFLVWPTGGLIANAAVTGIVPGLRFVMITDALLIRLDDGGIESVVGHELGHAWHRHLLKHLLVSIGYILLIVAVQGAIEAWAPPLPGWGWLAVGGVVLLAWGSVVRAFAHRFEMQADLYGVRLCGNVDQFVQALEMVGAINGQPRGIRTLLHPSIEERTAFVRAATESPAVGDVFEGRLRKMGTVAILAILALGAAAGAVVAEQWKQAPMRAIEYRARTLAIEAKERGLDGDRDAAERLLEEALHLEGMSPEFRKFLEEDLEALRTHRLR